MKRRKAREYALQLLFRVDFTENNIATKDFEEFWADRGESPEVMRFAEDLVRGTIEHMEEIDSMIVRVAENWMLDRIAAVDRNILRFAAFEIAYKKDIPSAVSINEALEIAKKFSSVEAASFLNGILDKLAKEAGKA